MEISVIPRTDRVCNCPEWSILWPNSSSICRTEFPLRVCLPQYLRPVVWFRSPCCSFRKRVSCPNSSTSPQTMDTRQLHLISGAICRFRPMWSPRISYACRVPAPQPLESRGGKYGSGCGVMRLIQTIVVAAWTAHLQHNWPMQFQKWPLAPFLLSPLNSHLSSHQITSALRYSTSSSPGTLPLIDRQLVHQPLSHRRHLPQVSSQLQELKAPSSTPWLCQDLTPKRLGLHFMCSSTLHSLTRLYLHRLRFWM